MINGPMNVKFKLHFLLFQDTGPVSKMKYSETHIHNFCTYREKRMINVGTRRLQEKIMCQGEKKINIQIFQLRPMKIVKHIKVTLIPVGTSLFYPKKYLTTV